MDVAEHLRTIWNRRDRARRGDRCCGRRVRLAGEPPATFEAQTGLQVSPAPSAQGTRPTGDDALFITEGYAERADTTAVLSEAARRPGSALDASRCDDRVVRGGRTASRLDRGDGERPSASDAAGAERRRRRVLGRPSQREQQEAAEAGSARCAPRSTSSPRRSPRSRSTIPRRAALQARHNALVAEAVEQELRSDDELAVVSPPDSDLGCGRHPDRSAMVSLAFLVALILSAELVVAATALGDRFSLGRPA